MKGEPPASRHHGSAGMIPQGIWETRKAHASELTSKQARKLSTTPDSHLLRTIPWAATSSALPACQASVQGVAPVHGGRGGRLGHLEGGSLTLSTMGC